MLPPSGISANEEPVRRSAVITSRTSAKPSIIRSRNHPSDAMR